MPSCCFNWLTGMATLPAETDEVARADDHEGDGLVEDLLLGDPAERDGLQLLDGHSEGGRSGDLGGDISTRPESDSPRQRDEKSERGPGSRLGALALWIGKR